LAASAVNLELPQRKQRSAESEADVIGLGDLPNVSQWCRMKLLLEPVANPLRNLATSAVNLELPQRTQRSAESELGVIGLGDLPNVSHSGVE
jgi:hypothetical protein